ncbi:MAG: hypothetical protein K2V38_21375 [Gemmataceae bacterium]|nr:hypothetical protein [Gemmataceae bacterium]
MHTLKIGLLAALLGALAGCGGNQPPFPDLHPAKGVVKRGGSPVASGTVQFTPDKAADFLVNAEVGADGTFALTTVRGTDSAGERKPGAPAGAYRVTYTPPLGDQTAGGRVNPINLPNPVTVAPGENNLTLELPKK